MARTTTRGTRRLRALSLSWVALLLLTVAVPALSQSSPPSITATPDSASVGETVRLDTTGFSGTPSFRFQHPDPAVFDKPLTVQSIGGGAYTFVVPDAPADPRVNGYRIIATEGSGEFVNRAETNFVVIPSLTIVPSRGPGGATFTLTGAGWERGTPSDTGGTQFVFEFRRTDTTDLPAPYDAIQRVFPQAGTFVFSGESRFTAKFTVPAIPAGRYLVETSQEERKLIQQVPFDVAPTLTLTPSVGPSGIIVDARGTGFDRPRSVHPSAQTVLVLFDGDVVGRFPANATATQWAADTIWDQQFNVPTRPPGRYQVLACQRAGASPTTCPVESEIFVRATFTVSPVSLFVEPDRGVGLTSATASGAGWNINEDITLLFDGDVIGTVPANSTFFTGPSSFEFDFEVPDLVADTYAVEACQRCGDPNEVAAVAPFELLAFLALDPVVNEPGLSTSGRGTGFDHDLQLRLFIGSTEVAIVSPGTPGFNGQTAFGIPFVTPSIPAGVYEAFACQRCGTATEIRADTPFRVIPALAVDPPVGPPGFVTFVDGHGFPANAEVILEWDIGLGTVEVTADANGSFRVPFLVMYNDATGPRDAVARLPGNELLPEAEQNPEPRATFLVGLGSGQPGDFQNRR